MTQQEAIKKIRSANTNLNLLLLRLGRMEREIVNLSRELFPEEAERIEKLTTLIETSVTHSQLPKKSEPEDLGWGPI
jgi:hypothetical protein